MNSNSENHEPTSTDELADRFIDRALAEVIGGETPPDLSEQILAGKRPSSHAAAEAAVQRRFGRRMWISLTAAAMVLVAAVPLIWSAVREAQLERLAFNAPPATPTPYYLLDDVQYYAPGSDFKAAREASTPEGGRIAEPGPGIVGPGPGQFSNALPQPGGVINELDSESHAIPGPQTPGARNTLESLGAEGLHGPVDVRFIEGANIVIIRGREQDVQQVMEQVKAIEGTPLGGEEKGQQGIGSNFGTSTQWLAQAPDGNKSRWGDGQQSATAGSTTPTRLAATPTPAESIGQASPGSGTATSAAAPAMPGGTLRHRYTYNGPTQLNEGQPATPAATVDRYGMQPDSAGKPEMLVTKLYDVKDLVVADGRQAETYKNIAEFKVEAGVQMMVTPRIVAEDGGERIGIPLGERESERPEKLTPDGTGPGLPGDQYVRIHENPFIKADGGAAVSTFSIDVDTASYANVRRFLLTENTLPPPDAVRIEELVNYFKYDYAPPERLEVGKDPRLKPTPFAAHIEVAGCPWKPEHRLVRIGIKGLEMDRRERPKSNLVFLVDVSGSMNEPNKLPLVIDGLKELARELGENDRVAIVVYAQQEGLVLPSTLGNERGIITRALDQLRAGGSTAGGAGIQLAYQIAQDHFIEGGTNRVILCTDGDFNVGVTSTAELQRMVEQKAKDTKVFLSVLGFGRGNLNDQMMEAISNRGNGNYSYVDSLREARRVFVEEMSGTLVTIAKDVKIQVEFNPRQVAGYRLLGYENRMLRTEDFNDDKKDAGEIGAGHTVTALYEIVPAGKPVDLPPVDELKYQRPVAAAAEQSQQHAEEGGAEIALQLLTLKMKYKRPDADTSEDTLQWPVTDDGRAFSAASADFQFASAVAGFGMLLRGSEHKGNLTYSAALELAQGGLGSDEKGYRAEFLDMIRRAKQLRGE